MFTYWSICSLTNPFFLSLGVVSCPWSWFPDFWVAILPTLCVVHILTGINITSKKAYVQHWMWKMCLLFCFQDWWGIRQTWNASRCLWLEESPQHSKAAFFHFFDEVNFGPDRLYHLRDCSGGVFSKPEWPLPGKEIEERPWMFLETRAKKEKGSLLGGQQIQTWQPQLSTNGVEQGDQWRELSCSVLPLLVDMRKTIIYSVHVL